MPRVCTICSHAQRADIDKALAGHAAANRALASVYGVSECAIRRHKAKHLPAAMAQGQAAQEIAHGDDLLAEIRNLKQITARILAKAEGAGQLSVACMAIREARANLELLGKLLGQLQDAAPVVNVLVTTPEYLTTRTRLLLALEPYPEARLAAAEAMQDVVR